jgi:hypothetical protein
MILRNYDLVRSVSGWILGGLAVWALIIFLATKIISKWGLGKNKKWAVDFQNKTTVRLMASISCLILPIVFLFFTGLLRQFLYGLSFLNTLLFPIFFLGEMGFYLLQFYNPYSGYGLAHPTDLIFLFLHWGIVIGLCCWISRKKSFVFYLSSFVLAGTSSILLVFFIFEKLGYQYHFATP